MKRKRVLIEGGLRAAFIVGTCVEQSYTEHIESKINQEREKSEHEIVGDIFAVAEEVVCQKGRKVHETRKGAGGICVPDVQGAG